MKLIKIINTQLIISYLMSCQTDKGKSNVILTDFTMELISAYINDADNLEAKKRKDEISYKKGMIPIIEEFANWNFVYNDGKLILQKHTCF